MTKPKPDTTIVGRITGTEQIETSANANPRWKVWITDDNDDVHCHRTEVDGSVGYDVRNMTARWNEGRKVIATVNPREHITRLQWADRRLDDE